MNHFSCDNSHDSYFHESRIKSHPDMKKTWNSFHNLRRITAQRETHVYMISSATNSLIRLIWHVQEIT